MPSWRVSSPPPVRTLGFCWLPRFGLVSGIGAGARVFDGRAVQPGRGAARPRGFTEGSAIPDGARVAVPRSLAMLAVLHAYRGRKSLHELARPGIEAAERAGAPRRAAVLRQFGDTGAMLLRARDVERALLSVGGGVAGGALTREDVEEARPSDGDAQSVAIDGWNLVTPPWDAAGEIDQPEGIVAIDGHGVVAGLMYTLPSETVELADLELVLGKHAEPVRRGIPRLPPGTPLDMPAPLAVLSHGPEFWIAIALSGPGRIGPETLGPLFGGAPLEPMLTDLGQRLGARAVAAVVRDGQHVRAIVV